MLKSLFLQWGKLFFFFPKSCECIHCIPGICKDHVQEHAAMRMYVCVLDVTVRKKTKVANLYSFVLLINCPS